MLPAAGGSYLQIAHFAGAGGFDDPGTEAALQVFGQAIQKRDARMSHVYFDITSVAGLGDWEAKKDLIVARAQQLFRTLPFFESEFQVIANNVTPYMPSGIEDERHPQI